ncbi:MAG: aspartate aminotransferase family protein [Methyloligellaceae bacterium]
MHHAHNPLPRNTGLQSSVERAEQEFIAANPHSQTRALSAAKAMPGGNTRTVLHYTPFPLTIASGEGAILKDIDGHTYVDFLGEYTAGLYGHSHPELEAAIQDALKSGVVLGGPNKFEANLAALMCERFPSLDLVRFCNSGTEANAFAISAARMFTKREGVMVFHGGYHGGLFYFGQTKPPTNAPFPFIYSTFNDIEKTRARIDANVSNLAAIVVEPMLGSAGAIPADHEFLELLRAKATEHDIVLIFDEVMTSRLSAGGLQEKLGIVPDLTAFGKYLGGGMTFGAFGGRADVMRRFNPYEPDAVSHAGTFNNNVLSMAAGLKGLRDIFTPDAARTLNATGEQFRDDLNALIAKYDAPMRVTGMGSILGVHFIRGPVRCAEDTWPADGRSALRLAQLQKLLHLGLLAAGQYIALRGFLSLSLPLEEKHYANFMEAFEEFVTTRGPVLELNG